MTRMPRDAVMRENTRLNVDRNRVSRSLKGWRGEIWHSRVNEVSVEGKACDLHRKLYEDLVCKVFRLLLQVFVRLDNECCDHSRE